MDRLHKLSHRLVPAYDVICLEDLHVKGMVKNQKLARHISDASWAALVSGRISVKPEAHQSSADG